MSVPGSGAFALRADRGDNFRHGATRASRIIEAKVVHRNVSFLDLTHVRPRGDNALGALNDTTPNRNITAAALGRPP